MTQPNWTATLSFAFYQLSFDVNTRGIAGMEALIRWKSWDDGFIYLSNFPLQETSPYPALRSRPGLLFQQAPAGGRNRIHLLRKKMIARSVAVVYSVCIRTGAAPSNDDPVARRK